MFYVFCFILLYLCKCILYYCLRMSTKLQLKIYCFIYIYNAVKIYCIIYIYIYIYPRSIIGGGIAFADWQSVELQLLLSAEVTIGFATVNEVLCGDTCLPDNGALADQWHSVSRRSISPASSSEPLNSSEFPLNPSLCSDMNSTVFPNFSIICDPEFSLTPPVTCSTTTTNSQFHAVLLSQ